MAYDRFLIAPFTTGLQTNTKPWLIVEDAFALQNNTYVFRGRVRKRFGSRFMGTGWTTPQTEPLFSRLRINIGNTTGGSFSGSVTGGIYQPGQMFSIGNEIFTVWQTGTPAAMKTTGASTLATYNTSNGAVNITGAAMTAPVWFYPALPVMGFANYERGPINNQPTYAFDTRFVYLFAGGFWQRSGTAMWNGGNLNFFWSSNYRGATPGVVALFTTNFHAVNPNGAGDANDDPIWWTIDGTNWVSGTGANAFYINPGGGAPQTGPFVKTALMVIGFKNRLLLLNTIENDGTADLGTNTNYVNRVRFSHTGSPFAQNAWYQGNAMDNAASNSSVGDGSGFTDATTEEAIVSAEFIKDRLIVYFQQSTWELAYTGNQVRPFVWQKINTELGSESTFSTVPFDKSVLTVGNTGIHSCNGSNVERIDIKIPNQVFQIVDKNSGVQRVFGIRDFYNELVYWSFPAVTQNPTEVYPSRILVYNYQNSSWSFNDDCITAYGYWEQQNGVTWASLNITWEEYEQTWASAPQQAQFRQIIGGNQEGYTFTLETGIGSNAQALQITNMVNNGGTIILTIIDHTLNNTPTGDYIYIKNSGVTFVTNQSPNLGIYKVVNIIDTNNVEIDSVQQEHDLSFTISGGIYLGGGTASRVSNIQMLSKQWNPYVDRSRNVFVAKIDFGVQKTSTGEITVDYYPSATELSMLQEAQDTGTLQGTGVLETFPYNPLYYPLEQQQDRLWHPIYLQTEGECIQIYLYFSPTQMGTPAISLSDFELDGMVLHTQPTSRLE